MADTLEKAVIKEICATGDKTNTIPDTTQSGSNALSYADGFPIATATPQSDGGIPPKRTDMNKVLNMLSKNQVFAQNGGAYSYDSSVATAIGGYPKGARLLYKDGRYEYYIESLKDNNSTEPTDESVYIVPNKAVIGGVAVVETTSQLPTATEDTLTDKYLCLADNKIYFTAINRQTQTYYWQGYSLTNSVFFAENTRAYWIYDTNNSSYVNANTIYSWVKTEDVKSVPMPDYSSINTTYSADVEHLASNNILVMVHLQAQDKTTPARFLIGANAGLTADVEIASWSIIGANSRADWFIPVPNGYRWKVVSGNITTVTIKVLNII